MMPMRNRQAPPRHEQRGPVIECAPVRVVDGRPPQDHDPGHIWPRYAETDGDADARLRRHRRRTERERHSSCQEHTFHRSPPAGPFWKGRARRDGAVATATAEGTYGAGAGGGGSGTVSPGRVTPVRRVPPQASTRRWRGDLLRSEEHTSELQSQSNLVCRLLLEKKK